MINPKITPGSGNTIDGTVLLTIDVEDWFQAENLRRWNPPHSWSHRKFRVEYNTNRILDLLDSIELLRAKKKVKFNKHPYVINQNSNRVRATFFILGWIAERMPDLAREIQARGHEVASHGYNHIMCNQLETKDLVEDIDRSRKTLEDVIGAKVSGYRAPNFSISDPTLKIIRNSGYKYDSSYNDFSRHGRYGTLTKNKFKKIGSIYKISDDFFEVPVSNLALGTHIIPWGGGGYFRFLPLPIFLSGVKRILKKNCVYIFYMHPWEIDTKQPKVIGVKGFSKWKHYLNISRTYQRLYKFITAFNYIRYRTCSAYVNEISAATPYGSDSFKFRLGNKADHG